MARRTAGRPSKTGATTKKAPATRKAAARKPAAKKTAPARGSKKTATKKATTAAKKTAPRKAARKKAAPKVVNRRKAAPATRKSSAKKAAAPKKAAASKKVAAPKKAATRKAVAPKRSAAPAKKALKRGRANSIDSRRRELEEMVPSPPSSLNMVRRGSAARTGRAEMAEHKAEDAHFTPSITAGDDDVNVEDAYFTGDEAPGGDNPTPDQDIVDEIGRALGVEYQDNEELRGADKLEDRDRHRWELDPASAEDYRDRD